MATAQLGDPSELADDGEQGVDRQRKVLANQVFDGRKDPERLPSVSASRRKSTDQCTPGWSWSGDPTSAAGGAVRSLSLEIVAFTISAC
jgi:hypothetical protein